MQRRLMKALAILMTLAVLAPATAAAETTAADRKVLLDHLERTKAAFLASIDGLNEAQWTWKPAADRWSVAEVAEHITTAESFLRGLVTNQVMTTEAAPDLLEKAKGKDEAVLKMIPDRSTRIQAPEPLIPKGAWPNRAALTTAFESARDETVRLAGDAGQDLRAHAMESPMGPLDAYQWLLFVSAHTERHTKQIEEVKNTQGFPSP